MQNLTSDFIQVQKSFIVNFKKIDSMTFDFITIDGTTIPIGAQFKNALAKKIKL